MEGLVRLVTESLERHGLTVPPARIDWSDWTPLVASLCLNAPSNPGLFVVVERLVSHNVVASGALHRLAILRIAHTNDLGIEIARLCLHSSLRDRIAAGHCLIRYAAVDDDAHRISACAALQHWYTNSPEISAHFPAEAVSAHSAPSQPVNPAPLPSGF